MTGEDWDWMVFKGPFQALNILWFCVSCLGSVCLKCLNSRQYQQARAVLLCLVPQVTAAPEVLFQPRVIFHRLERWKTTSPRQQFPSFQLTGQLQLSDVAVVAGAATGSRFQCWGWFCRWFIYHKLELGAVSRWHHNRHGAMRGLPQGTTLGCFFSLV